MISPFLFQLAQMQLESFKQLNSQQMAGLQNIGMLAGMAGYSRLSTPIADQMRHELDAWLKDWNE